MYPGCPVTSSFIHQSSIIIVIFLLTAHAFHSTPIYPQMKAVFLLLQFQLYCYLLSSMWTSTVSILYFIFNNTSMSMKLYMMCLIIVTLKRKQLLCLTTIVLLGEERQTVCETLIKWIKSRRQLVNNHILLSFKIRS